MKLEKVIACFTVVMMCSSIVVGCGVKNKYSDAKEGIKVSDKKSESSMSAHPKLNLLYNNMSDDLNKDPILPVQEKLSGYKVKIHYLPAENASQKLMMEIAGGADYDMIMRVGSADFSQLVKKNALMDLTGLLDKYGKNIKDKVSEYAWNLIKSQDGKIYGIPFEMATPDLKNNKDAELFQKGLGFRSDILKELGCEVPQTLEELDNVLTKFKEKTGNAPLTMSKGNIWFGPIMSAFGMGNSSWYDNDGSMTYKIKNPGFKDYIAYIEKLYHKGLIDNDMPINAVENVQEKFANGIAMCAPLAFFDIPTIKDALEKSNPDAKVLFSAAFTKTGKEQPIATVGKGFEGIIVIPKAAKHPEDAMKWYNTLSTTKNFTRVFIGEEGKSYEIKNGKYYPIFPAFDDYLNSQFLTGSFDVNDKFVKWQARTQKTKEMGEAYEQMNEISNKCKVVANLDSYSASLPSMENMSSIEQAVSDQLLKGVVDGTDPAKLVKELQKIFADNGGNDCEKQMKKWYTDNKKYLK